MEIKNRTLLLFGIILLLIGLVIGCGFGYMIYQPQIQSLQSKIADLDSVVTIIENRTWHEAYSLESSSDAVTGTIQLKGSQVRASWIANGDYSTSWFSVQLHFSNGTAYAIWGSSGVWTANDGELELKEHGSYYLNITVYHTDYYISFWDYY